MTPGEDIQDSTKLGTVTQLIERVRAGEVGAEDKLLESIKDRLFALIRKMLNQSPRVRRWDETGDLFPELWLRIRKALLVEPIRDRRHFFRIVNLHMNWLLCDLARRFSGPETYEGRHQTGVALADAGDKMSERGSPRASPERAAKEIRPTPSQFLGPRPPGPFTAVALKDDHFLIHRLISMLSDEETELVGLIYYQELTQQEAAEVLQVDERTIRRRLPLIHRNLGRLRRGAAELTGSHK